MSREKAPADLDIEGLLDWDDDDFDERLVQTPGFQAMMERSRLSLENEPTVPGDVVLQEALEALAQEQAEGRYVGEMTAAEDDAAQPKRRS